jgi:D-alanyl-D-alanine carboxypeptidase
MRNLKDSSQLPFVTAEAWCVLDTDCGGKMVHGKFANHKREVASLTKMMTFYVSWQLY